jgi:FlaA1/EpsC-like NDP-sugar epimerase
MRNRYVLLLDLPLVVLAAMGAFLLRFDWFFPANRPEFIPFAVAALLIKPAVFAGFGLYGRYWMYATVADMQAVVVGVTAGSVALGLFVAAAVLTHTFAEFSRSVLLMDWLLTLLAIGGFRFSLRLFNERRLRHRVTVHGPVRNVLVIGAGVSGASVLRELERNPALGLRPIGLVDDDPVKRGKRIVGVKVLGNTGEIPVLVESYAVREAIIAMPGATGAKIREVAKICAAAGIESRTIPGMFELLDGGVSVQRLRQVEITDLLRRPEILGPVEAAPYLASRTVLVTGAGGSIGVELCRQIAHAHPRHLVLLGHGENSLFDAQQQLLASFPNVPLTIAVADIRDRNRVEHLFLRHRPEIVFHAAAHKHVPLMELNPEEAVTNNVIGTLHVVAAAAAAGTTRLVLISSDKAVGPRSIMGASKRVAEQIVAQASARTGRAFAVVRFGNVLGSRGSVVPTFKRQIEAGGPVTITHPDMTRFFMTIPEAVHLVVQAGGLARGGELFVLNMGEPIRITQLAEDLIALSGAARDEIPIVYTGLRPGEKLTEQLWEDDAVVKGTEHADILRVTEPSSADVPEVPFEELAEAARRSDAARLQVLLAQQVSSYVPADDPASIVPSVR